MDALTPETARLVVVAWEDIVQYQDWNEWSESHDTLTVKTVGWLIEETPRKIVVAGSYNYADEQWADLHAFPKMPPELFHVERLENSLRGQPGDGDT